MYTPKGKTELTEVTIMTREEKSIAIIEGQNRNIQSFIEALEEGLLTDERYKELVRAELSRTREMLAELN